MSATTVRERLAAFLAECAIGEGEESTRVSRGFHDHLAELDPAALAGEAAAHWQGILATYFDNTPGREADLRVTAAAAIASWPEEKRSRFLTDIGVLVALDDPDISGLNALE